jgi:hypothetical protein
MNNTRILAVAAAAASLTLGATGCGSSASQREQTPGQRHNAAPMATVPVLKDTVSLTLPSVDHITTAPALRLTGRVAPPNARIELALRDTQGWGTPAALSVVGTRFILSTPLQVGVNEIRISASAAGYRKLVRSVTVIRMKTTTSRNSNAPARTRSVQRAPVVTARADSGSRPAAPVRRHQPTTQTVGRGQSTDWAAGLQRQGQG